MPCVSGGWGRMLAACASSPPRHKVSVAIVKFICQFNCCYKNNCNNNYFYAGRSVWDVIVAAQPAESAVLSGGPSGAHRVDGIGAGHIVPQAPMPPWWMAGARTGHG